MEHLVRQTYSNSFLLATGCVFFFAMLLWFIWARFFPEKDAIKKISGFVVVFGLVMLFFYGGKWPGRGGLLVGPVFAARDLYQV